MIKILPSRLEGSLSPASENESLIVCLALAAFSDKPCRVIYKSLSDDVMCAIFVLEKTGASFKIDKREIFVEPAAKREFDYLYVNFRDSKISLIYLLPILKSLVEVLDADCSEKLALENMSEFLHTLAECGCKIRGKRFPMTIRGKISKEIYPKVPELADAFLTSLVFNGQGMNGCELSDKLPAHLSRFGIRVEVNKKITTSGALVSPEVTEAESDFFYLSLFAAGSKSLKADSPLPEKLLPLIKCEPCESCFILTPRLFPVRADFEKLGELFLPALILALRAVGKSVFENYSSDVDFHNRLIQLFEDLRTDYSIERGLLTINSSGIIAGEAAREWSDERFSMTACMASLFSEKGVVVDSEKNILSRFPDFFDDMRELGGKLQNL